MAFKEMIGARIKRLRQVKKLTQEQLSEKMGITSKYLSSIERGKENPTLDTLIKLALALDIEILEIFNYSKEKSPKDLRRAIDDLLKVGNKEQLELAVRILKALYLT